MLILFSVYTRAYADQATVWFAPESHYPPVKGSDFVEAFDDPSAWASAAKKMNVLLISTQTFLAAPDDFIRKIVDFTKRNHLALGVAGEFQCGKIPGTSEMAQKVVQSVSKAGGSIDYIAMDEPLYHVHYSKTAEGCQLSVDETAQRVASVIRVFEAINPNVVIGDVEPFPIITDDADWRNTFKTWISGFKRETGRDISFLHLDFNWREKRLTKGNADVSDADAIKSLARNVAAFAQDRNLALGVIINGKATARTDEEWVEQALQNFNFILDSGIPVKDYIFASWHAHPQKIAPDTDPFTFSGLILKALSLAKR